jgi:hypothetical protein
VCENLEFQKQNANGRKRFKKLNTIYTNIFNKAAPNDAHNALRDVNVLAYIFFKRHWSLFCGKNIEDIAKKPFMEGGKRSYTRRNMRYKKKHTRKNK